MGDTAVGMRFSLGLGPRPLVEKVSTYFQENGSIASTLNLLLDQFNNLLFQNYQQFDEDVFETQTCIIVGKDEDRLKNIKGAFTRLR